jgi:hypothetical protein
MSVIRTTEILEKCYNGDNKKSLEVGLQNKITDTINLYFARLVQMLTIVNDAEIGDTIITVSSDAQPTNGNIICIQSGERCYQGVILSSTANDTDWDVTIDTPLDAVFNGTSSVAEKTIQLKVDGSATPVVFDISPANLNDNIKWDVTKIIFEVIDDSAMDDTKFGGGSALTKGLVLRRDNEIIKNIVNLKTNGDMFLKDFNIVYSDKKGAGNHGLNAKRVFAGQENSGVAIRLKAETDDALKIIVQDDLTGLVSFKALAVGHIVG